MSCTVTLHGLPEGYKHPFSHEVQEPVIQARFARENVAQGVCLRKLEEINDLLRPNGVFVTRLDLRYCSKVHKKLLLDCTPDNEEGVEELEKKYFLPMAALQGLCISCFQYFAVEGTEFVDPKFGPFARWQDGGAYKTEGEGLGSFPKLAMVTEEKFENINQHLGPFHTNGAEDGTSTNEVFTVMTGTVVACHRMGYSQGLRQVFSGIWNKNQVPKERPQLPGVTVKIELTCDADTGWRVINRGDIPASFILTPGTKYVQQVIGPEKWKMSPCEDQSNPFFDG